MKRFLLLILLFVFFNTVLAQPVYIFTGNGNWSDSLNWLNQTIPPGILPAHAEIRIEPADTTGECVLDVSQIISADAIFTLPPSSRFRIPGNLTINSRPNTPDSVNVLVALYNSDGGRTYFTYDSVHHRYSNWYIYYGPYNYDTTYIFYDSAGRISYLVDKGTDAGDLYTTVQVFTYHTDGRLACVYVKNPVRGASLAGYDTVISTRQRIQYCDTLLYNNLGQVTEKRSCRITETGDIESAFVRDSFTYDAGNYTVLTRVQTQLAGETIMDDFTFHAFDTMQNPLYNSVFRWYGFFPVKAPIQFLPPDDYNTSSTPDGYGGLHPHNCIRASAGSITTDIVYAYTNYLLPNTCRTGFDNSVGFQYRRYRVN